MTTCHQCGSEVAENDAFCPYCGITLRPIDLSNDEDSQFESTIVMAPDDAVTAIDDEPAVSSDMPAAEPTEPATRETPTALSDIPEPPTPSVLAEMERSADTPEVTEQSEPDREQPAGFGAVLPPDEVREQVPNTADEAIAAQEDSQPDPEVPVSLPEPGPDELPPALRTEMSESAEIGELHDESAAVSEPVIGPPDEALESPDAYSNQSMFDSVRIIDDKYRPSSFDHAKPAAGDSVADERKAVTPSAEPPPQTKPNIGLVDTDGRRSVKLKPLDEGIVLNGRYEIVRKIGGGGMGAVYLASDNNLGGVLRAVKEMVQAHIEEDQQAKAIEDFKRESMILSQLDHPSIPTIYDYFFDQEEGRFYLVMKYISGGDLAARLRSAPEGRIDEKTVTEWAVQIADVLDYLHNQPSTIVYRDLKPSNIMIDGNSSKVMLIDFGIARSISQKEEKGVTAVGTMGYAPPELFSGNVEPRSDIYSLGSTVFHLLTGADPQSNPLLIFDFQKNPRPRQINSQLSDQIERFIMRSVEYNADARFATAAEARQYLAEHLANLDKGTVTYGIKEAPAATSLANQAVFCGFCGQRIVATDLFCAFCGAKQPIAQPGVHSEVYSRSKTTARLVIEGTSDLEAPAFSLEKDEILIGRRDPMSNIFPEVDLSKYDPQTKISRRHARIWREGNTYLVEDLGSSNGTLLLPIVHESVRLQPRQPHALTNGDKLRVGDTTLHFVVG